MMRRTPHYMMTDPAEVKRLIHAHPWATFVSYTEKGLIASHYPVLLDRDDTDGITIVSHFGRPDDRNHELGEHEVMVIVQGPHDYVSSSWYEPGDLVPTWNHLTAHLWGVPEVLSDEENYRMLELLTKRFEHGRQGARSLSEDEEGSRKVAMRTVGLRMKVTRFDARAKLSQNKSPEVRGTITEHLAEANPELADEMRRAEPSAGTGEKP